jgi:hypothetical protein
MIKFIFTLLKSVDVAMDRFEQVQQVTGVTVNRFLLNPSCYHPSHIEPMTR